MKRIILSVFIVFIVMSSSGCMMAAGAVAGSAIGMALNGITAPKGADTVPECSSCIKTGSYEDAVKLRQQIQEDLYKNNEPSDK